MHNYVGYINYLAKLRAELVAKPRKLGDYYLRKSKDIRKII